jgi:hypothetical protein
LSSSNLSKAFLHMRTSADDRYTGACSMSSAVMFRLPARIGNGVVVGPGGDGTADDDWSSSDSIVSTEHGGGDGGGFETVDHSEINIADDDVHQVSRYSRLLNASGNQDNLSRRYTLRKRDLPGQKHQITIPLGLICPCVRVLTSGFVLLLSGTQYKVLCQMFPEKRHQSTLPRAPFQTGPLHNCLPAAGH